MKKAICVLLSIILCFYFASCNKGNAPYAERTFYVMDTVFTLRIYGENEDAQTHFSAVLDLLTEIENALSRTVEQSDVSRLNRDRTAGELSPHTFAVLQTALKAFELTGGTYLPTMGAVSDLWQEAGRTDTLPDAAVLDEALSAARQGFVLENGICRILGQGALLDLGGIGKGYAADAVLNYLQNSGVSGALFSFGSSVATLGEKGNGEPFKISLRHPRSAVATVGVLTNPAGVLSVSGDYERYVTVNGERYHHVLDPQNGYPASAGLASVAVICESGALSDALSTAFLVMGREKAETLLAAGAVQAEAVFITPDGECTATSGLDFQT